MTLVIICWKLVVEKFRIASLIRLLHLYKATQWSCRLKIICLTMQPLASDYETFLTFTRCFAK
ncbi:hypothetical protein D3C76_1776080 [compost metagenome]